MSTTYKAAALAYARAGFPVLPVWWLAKDGKSCACSLGKACETPGKHPLYKAWQKMSNTDPARVAALFDKHPQAHIGIMPPEDCVILDIDPRNGGDKSFKALLNGSKMPATPTQRSGGGGWHFVLRGNVAGALGKGIDIKRPGRGFVVAAPSGHTSGTAYAWRTPFSGAIADLPSELQSKPRTEHPAAQGSPIAVPLATVAAALAHVPAEEYARWINVGQALRNAYGEEGQAIWEDWSRTSTKWKEADAAKWDSFDHNRDRPLITLRSIMSMARRNGYRPLTQEFSGGLWAQGDISNLFNTEPPPLDWVFQPCIPAGKVTLLAGAGGSSKSYLTLTLAMQLGIRQEFGPFIPGPTPGKTMLLVAEEDKNDVHRRLHAVCTARLYTDEQKEEMAQRMGVVSVRGLDWRLLQHDQAGDLHETDRVDYLIDELCALGDVRMLVLDPLVAFNGADENNNAEMSRLMFTLDRIADRVGCAIVVIHHVSKGGQIVSLNEATQAVIRGASALVDNARSAILLTRMPRNDAPLYNIQPEQAGKYVVARVVKNNYGPHVPDVIMAVESGGALRMAPEVVKTHTSVQQAAKAQAEETALPRLLAALHSTPKASQRELAISLGFSQPRITQLFGDAVREGYVERIGVGSKAHYEITAAGLGVASIEPDERKKSTDISELL